MKYCRFLLHGHIRYGSVENRNGELWIAGPSPAPAEDLAYRLALDETSESGFDFAHAFGCRAIASPRHAVQNHLCRTQLSRARSRIE